jgi:hydroxymethylpyrimidine pyrophosphatase-like HAD family hydrolase
MMQPTAPREVLTAVRSAQDLIFDVDLTLTERQKALTSDLASALAATDKRLGICTSRALNELDEVFNDLGQEKARPTLMRGPVILEDGGLVIKPGDHEPTLLVPKEHYEAVATLVDYIKEQVDSESCVDGTWYRLKGLDSPLVHLPTRYNYMTSFSIWQHHEGGLEVLKGLLPNTMEWVRSVVSRLGVGDNLHLLEIGDGTLRIAAPGRSKGVALQELHEEGIIDLSKTVYFGDGKNDVPAAQVIRQFGGVMIAVDTHCKELVDLASYTLPARGPEGLRRFLAGTFR